MKKITTFILMVFVVSLCLGNTKCTKIDRDNIKTGLQITYTLSEQVRELNKQVNILKNEGKINEGLHDNIIRQSLYVFDGIEFVNNQAKDQLELLEQNIVTKEYVAKFLQKIISDNVLIPLNAYLVKLNLISKDRADAILTIIRIVRDIAKDIISQLDIKDVKVVAVEGA